MTGRPKLPDVLSKEPWMEKNIQPKQPSYVSLEAQFKTAGYEAEEAKRRNQRVGSWDTQKRYNQAITAADTILDLTLELYPEVTEATVLKAS